MNSNQSRGYFLSGSFWAMLCLVVVLGATACEGSDEVVVAASTASDGDGDWVLDGDDLCPEDVAALILDTSTPLVREQMVMELLTTPSKIARQTDL